MSTKGGGEAVQRRELENPKRILLFSGKRKCGKDFITDLLVERYFNDHSKSVVI